MLGLFLIYFIGKSFYELAHEFHKGSWGFAVLGILSYYAGTIVGDVILALMMGFGYLSTLTDMPQIVLSLITIPLGVLTCWGFYKLLEYQWGNEPVRNSEPEVLDQNLIR